MRKWIVLLVLFISISGAAQVYGDIYEEGSLKMLNNTVVTLKSADYSYRQVFSGTNYSFDLPDGTYELSAERYDGSRLTHMFNETIHLNGKKMRIDFVLSSVSQPASQQMDAELLALAGVGLAIVLILAYRFLSRKKQVESVQNEEKPEPAAFVPDDETKKVLETIKANEGRMTQKELREILNFSDAKMSLILSELEHYGKIKRFKKGRGNIVRSCV